MASIIDVTDITLGIGTLEFGYYDSNNNEMRFVPYEESRPRRR